MTCDAYVHAIRSMYLISHMSPGSIVPQLRGHGIELASRAMQARLDGLHEVDVRALRVAPRDDGLLHDHRLEGRQPHEQRVHGRTHAEHHLLGQDDPLSAVLFYRGAVATPSQP